MDFMLPFKVGDAVESRSFSPGFRGAWFRCKVSAMYIRQGHLECHLEYIDYPDEKKRWTRLYKIRPGSRKQTSSQSREIMVRPCFPQWYWENQISDPGLKTDVVAIVSAPWKVGDLIDWWYTGCYWTGKIIELLGDDKVKIVLPEWPLGEGGYYDADCKDLRPALDWSLEKGWSMPPSQENGKCWYTARLITQNSDTESSNSDEDIEQSYDGNDEIQKCLNGTTDMPEEVTDSDVKLPANENNKCCMNNQTHGEEEPQNCLNEESDTPLEVIDSKVKLLPKQNGKCCMNSETDSPIAKPGVSLQVLTNGQSSPTSVKKRKISTEHASVEPPPDTVDGAIMELEKVANKIRCVEDLLLSIGSAPSNTAKPFWKFLAKDASAKDN